MGTDGRWSADRIHPDRCRRMAQQLRSVDAVLAEYTAGDPDWAGLAGSTAEAERLAAHEESRGMEIALGAAHTLMHLYMFAAVLHLRSISTLLEVDDTPADSIMVLTRSVLELSARTWWLADPSIGLHGRVARGFLEKLYSAREHELLRSASSQGGIRSSTSVRELEQEATRLSLAVGTGRRTFKVHNQTRSNIVDLLQTFPGSHVAGPQHSFFRLFCQPAHGSVFGVTLHFTAAPLDEMGKTTGTYRVAQHWVDGPVSTAILSCCWAVQRVAQLLGWNPTSLDRLLTAVDDMYVDAEDPHAEQTVTG